MCNSTSAPATLAEAEQRFQTFLVKNGYPGTICWTTSADVLARAPRQFWIRSREDGAAQAKLTYGEGLSKGLGLELRALCVSDQETFAFISLPSDRIDAERHMIGPCLKLSCPVDHPLGLKVRSRIKWLFLLRRDKGRSKAYFE